MKLSVSLPDGDVQFVDRYVSEHDAASRSAVVREALALLRERDLMEQYKAAWREWVEDGGEIWDLAVGDGIEDE